MNKYRPQWHCVASGVFLSLCSAAAVRGDLVLYTNRSDFLAAASAVLTLDFDSLDAGTVIADGAAVEGVAFSYDYGGSQIQVSNAYDSTSATNSLGTDSGDNAFLGGDDFTLSFAPRSAVGLSIITSPDEIFDGDFTLTAGLGSVSLNSSATSTLPDGGKVFFLGIIDTEGTFSSASLESIDGGFFLYNVDDVTLSAVPEVGSFALLGIAGVFALVQPLLRFVGAKFLRFHNRSNERS